MDINQKHYYKFRSFQFYEYNIDRHNVPFLHIRVLVIFKMPSFVMDFISIYYNLFLKAELYV